jgi:hypothetical protein
VCLLVSLHVVVSANMSLLVLLYVLLMLYYVLVSVNISLVLLYVFWCNSMGFLVLI